MNGLPEMPEQIVIEGTREDWPGGCQTLTPVPPALRPRPATLCFGAQVEPAGHLVWFLIDADDINRIQQATTPEARGTRLVDCLIIWITESQGNQLEDHNEFQVIVEGGEPRIAPCG